MASIPAELTPTLRGDAYYWRLVGTAFAFATFGLGAVLVGLIAMPLVRLGAANAVHRARQLVAWSVRAWLSAARRLKLVTYEFHGLERLGRPGQLLVANHPSLIDVLFLLAYAPGANCIVKREVWRSALTRGVVTTAQYISNEFAAEMIDSAAQALRGGQTLIMFPEGTRTTPNRAPVFQRGAAAIAIRAARIVTPVYVRCEPTTLTKAEPWYRIPPRRPHYSFVVGPDLDVDAFRGPPAPIASRRFNELLAAHFAASPACLSVKRVG